MLSSMNFFSKTVVLISNKAIGYSGNIKLAHESETLKNELNGYRIVLLSYDRNEPGIYLWSFYGVILALFSKYYILSVLMPPFVSAKRKVVLQLWHGVPMKCIGVNANVYTDEVNARFVREFNHYNYIIVSGDRFQDILKNSFQIKRDSTFVRSGNFVQEDLLRRKVTYDQRKMKILYAPTFREQQDNRAWDLLFDRDQLESWLERNDLSLFCKYHPKDEGAQQWGSSNRVIILDGRHDINQYLLEADVLVTDYSSVAFDASLLGKEVYFYTQDIDEYAQYRGLCCGGMLQQLGYSRSLIDLDDQIKSKMGVGTRDEINADYHQHLSEDNIAYIISNLIKYQNVSDAHLVE